MNLLDYLSSIEAWSSSYEKKQESQISSGLKAGGPGSGRHPGDVAQAYGYKPMSGYPARGANKMYEHPDGQTLMTRGDDHWVHKAKYGDVKTGDGGDALDSHLESIHGNIKSEDDMRSALGLRSQGPKNRSTSHW